MRAVGKRLGGVIDQLAMRAGDGKAVQRPALTHDNPRDLDTFWTREHCCVAGRPQGEGSRSAMEWGYSSGAAGVD
jgi:hypothetical protein